MVTTLQVINQRAPDNLYKVDTSFGALNLGHLLPLSLPTIRTLDGQQIVL